MKVLFLDIDGVCNSIAKSYLSPGQGSDYQSLKAHLDPDNMRVFSYMMHSLSDVKLVISSSWRSLLTLKQWNEVLKGFYVDNPVIGMTLQIGNRNKEIAAFIRQHPEITRYLALDDEHLEVPSIRTSGTVGLTKEDAEKVYNYFDGDTECIGCGS